jgi:alpha-tubulin suppressor-like RCC1 family protein
MMHCLFLLSCLLWALPASAADSYSPVTGVAGVAAGEFHSCLLIEGGGVECLGLNEHGQLGDGSTRQRVTAGPVSGLDDATQVVAGAAHSCALREDDTVACWGRNEAGQLGNGSTLEALAPTPVANLSGVKALSAGGQHTCAVTHAGAAWCWGANDAGQLGDGTTVARSIPTLVVAPLAGVARIDAGGSHTCAVSDAGAMYCWGANAEGQLGTGNTMSSSTPLTVTELSQGIVAVAAGVAHSCAARGDGSVACWGRSPDFDPWGGPQSPPRLSPVAIDGVQGAVALTAGIVHSCALRSDATVTCWGGTDSYHGEVFTGLATIDATHAHTCAVRLDGQVRCWGGDQRFGERGTGYAGVRLDAVHVRYNTRDIEAGDTFACSLDTSGFVRCWGMSDPGGVLGDQDTYAVPPRLIPELSGVTALSASEFHACTLTGPVARCWGGMGAGEIGLEGVEFPWPKPTRPVTGIAPLESIHAGAVHTCAVTQSGGATCWGQGPLGDGTLHYSTVPVPVGGLSTGVARISGGLAHRCALLDDGTVKCWGHLYTSVPNAPNPTIGDGSGVSQLMPVAIPGLEGVEAIEAGFVHTCALLDSGRVRCWGFNSEGQLGDGTTTARFTPVDVPGLENVVALHAGMFTTCAVLADASAACWGRGHLGQLGNGRLESSPVPVPVTAWDAPIADFGIGENFACAVSTTGELRCWGSNVYLQLGEAGLQGAFYRTVQRSLAPYRVFDGGFESN